MPALRAGLPAARAQLAEVLELSLRSCNVLIEKFHHSLFLYLQSSPERYVSIDMYVIAPVALLAALLLQAAAAKQQHDALRAQQGSWAGSIRRVLLAHAACAVLGLGLRRALQPGAQQGPALEQLLQPGAGQLGSWAAGGCVAVLLASALSSGRSSGGRGRGAGQQAQGQEQQRQQGEAAVAERLRTKVALLSLAAMALSALVCLNWALAYACLLVVSPLAVLATSTAPQQQQQAPEAGEGQGQAGAAQRRGPSLRRRLAAAVLSPIAVAVYLQLLSGNGVPGLSDAVGMVVASRGLTYMVFWSVYVPFWWLCTFNC
jgi:hypothetical protein